MTANPLARGIAVCHARLRAFCTAAAGILTTRNAWLVHALFLLAGVAVLDDYAVSVNAHDQRDIGRLTVDYVLTGADDLLYHENRAYGVAFEALLALAERLWDLKDSRAVYLQRHFLTHFLFLTGGLGCAALAYRLYGSRWLALCAQGLFLLHPRLYAHSFFNSKDIPFLSLFMLALLLLHRTFRRDTGAAFALCGAGVGLLINIRPMGLLLFGVVLALRAWDCVYAADRAARRHALRTGGLFVLTSALTLYAAWPYLWRDPIGRFADAFAFMADIPHTEPMLFAGRRISSLEVPPEYVPVWSAITTPPYALLLGGIGLAVLLRRVVRAPGALLHNTSLRFESLLLACYALSVLATILLGSTLYDGWRHTYFLYAPFCLLAIGGLRALTVAARRLQGQGLRAYGVTGAGACAVLSAMALLHPDQHLYFNFLVDRATPERLRTRYDWDYVVSIRRALEFLLARYPDETLYINTSGPLDTRNFGVMNWAILPAGDRQRVAFVDVGRADFHIAQPRARQQGARPYAPVIHTRKVYGNTLFTVAAINLAQADAATAAPYRAAYQALAEETPVFRDRLAIYLDEHAVSWIQDPCRPEDMAHQFILQGVSRDPRNPFRVRLDDRHFSFSQRGVRVEDACLAVVPQPVYPLQHLKVGQYTWVWQQTLWQADILAPSIAETYRAAYRTLEARPPVSRADFNVYVTASAVLFAKTPCTEEDTQAKFFLHITPVDPRAWPEHGFDNRDFRFFEYGVRFDRTCLAAVPRPAYPIQHLKGGQWQPETGHALWQADIPVPRAPRVANEYRAAYRALTAEPPTRRAVFDVYVTADAVAYAKAPCTEEDTAPRFILHVVPARPRELPPERRRAGFDNRDFQFAWQGAHFDGRCLARAPLPAYPIDRLRVGQFRTGESSPLWSEEIPLAR